MDRIENILREYIAAYEQGVIAAKKDGDKMDIYVNTEVLNVLKAIADRADIREPHSKNPE